MMNQFKLFKIFIKYNIGKCVVAISITRYSNLEITVRWNTTLSRILYIGIWHSCSSRCCIKSVLLNIFINTKIVNIRNFGQGCHINSCFLGCYTHADVLIIILALMLGLHLILNPYILSCNYLSLCFNVKKSNDLFCYFGPPVWRSST